MLGSQNTGRNFWSMWAGASTQGCSHSGKAPVVGQSSRTHQALASLKVNSERCLKKRTLDNFLPYFPRWVVQRKACIDLCCKKLTISARALDSITKVLNMQLDCIQEAQVTWIWHPSILRTFPPLPGQTSSVQRPRLSRIHGLPVRSSGRKWSGFPLSF